MMRHLVFRSLHVRDIPPTMRHDGVKVGGRPLTFAEQRTGYGVRKLFYCPSCGERRMKLVIAPSGIYCHGCAPFNVYRQRCNLYDNGGEALVTYHMQKLAASIGITIKWPFCYLEYLKPKGMRWSRWQSAMKQLQAMEGMRNTAIFFRRSFTAQDIKARTRPEALEGYTLDYLSRYLIL